MASSKQGDPGGGQVGGGRKKPATKATKKAVKKAVKKAAKKR